MFRSLLISLLLLCACAPKAPDGTVKPNADGEVIVRLQSGDTKPFQVEGGDTEFLVHSPIGGPDAPITACAGRLNLYAYPKTPVQAFIIDQPESFRFRVNAMDKGVYFLRYQVGDESCVYDVLITKSS